MASSDALNISGRIDEGQNGQITVTGRKWWISGAGDPRCKVCLFLGKHSGMDGGRGGRGVHVEGSAVKKERLFFSCCVCGSLVAVDMKWSLRLVWLCFDVCVFVSNR